MPILIVVVGPILLWLLTIILWPWILANQNQGQVLLATSLTRI